MLIIKFLLANWDSVLLVIAAFTIVIILYRRGEIKVLKNLLFLLITKAEKEFGNGTGELKRAAVLDWVYARLPRIVTIFITRAEIEKLLEAALAYAKQRWAVNQQLSNYINEDQTSLSSKLCKCL
jgi:alpha/beta superfamily hydrolase